MYFWLEKKSPNTTVHIKFPRVFTTSTEPKELWIHPLQKLGLLELLLELRWWDWFQSFNSWHGISPFNQSTISLIVVLRPGTWAQMNSEAPLFLEDSMDPQQQSPPNILNVLSVTTQVYRASLQSVHTTQKIAKVYWNRRSGVMSQWFSWRIKICTVIILKSQRLC